MVFAPIPLPADFPIEARGFFSQGDAPITFLHAHDCLELGCCFEGAGVFVVGEKVLPFQAGAISFIGPSEFHLARSMAGTQSKWVWVYLDPARLAPGAHAEPGLFHLGHLAGRSFRNIITPQMDPLAGGLVRQLIDELRDKPHGHRTAVAGLVAHLMARVNRLAPRRRRATEDNGLNRALHRVAPALDLMAARYAENLPMAGWARACRVSVTHFRRLFRQAVGKSPHRYLTELRVRMAATRLHATPEKIVMIAQETGFPTLSSFNRAFRQVIRLTPRQWRAQR